MNPRTFLAAAILTMTPAIPLAEAAATPPPRPGPEHQKLAPLVGEWTSEGECVATPMTPAEKWSTKLKNEWFKGGFAVVRHLTSKGSVTGETAGLEVITYDGDAKAYTWYGVDSTGWTATIKGKTYKARGSMKGLGSDKLLWSMDYSEDGKTWKPACTATDVRVKAN
jgi:hypothetical protein